MEFERLPSELFSAYEYERIKSIEKLCIDRFMSVIRVDQCTQIIHNSILTSNDGDI